MKNCLFILTAVILLSSSAFSVETEKNKSIVIPALKGEIKLDGKLDEPAWQKALSLTPFLKNTDSQPAEHKTEVKLWYDENNLYFGWICEGKNFQTTYTKHDATLWEGEVAECFITPKDRTKYYELQWNPLSATFDALITVKLGKDGWQESMKGDWNWTATGMKHAIFVDGTVGNAKDTDKVWQAEVILPFSALGTAAPKASDVWFGNFYRYCFDNLKSPELISINPTTRPSFHEPSRFMEIRFGNQSSSENKNSQQQK